MHASGARLHSCTSISLIQRSIIHLETWLESEETELLLLTSVEAAAPDDFFWHAK
jgi:hypothetical protein